MGLTRVALGREEGGNAARSKLTIISFRRLHATCFHERNNNNEIRKGTKKTIENGKRKEKNKSDITQSLTLF